MVKLGQSPKVLCISHIKDVDGCVCAALIRYATKSKVLLTNYGNINQCLRRARNKYDFIYICDLGINESIINEFQRIREQTEITYIDHHHIEEDLLEKLEKMDINIVHDQRDCAGVLTFNLFKEILPREAGLLAAYAAISDRLEDGPLGKKISRQYDREFIFYETMVLSYALDKADDSFKKKIVHRLSKLEYPHRIKDVPTLALEQIERIAILRNELPLKASKIGDVAFIEVIEDSPGAIANLLLDVCNATIGICYRTNPQSQVSDLSIRGRTSIKVDLGKITAQLAKRFEGFGGGHPKACGARIPTLRIMEFISALVKHTE
jgi:RecJ-like exonuclease